MRKLSFWLFAVLWLLLGLLVALIPLELWEMGLRGRNQAYLEESFDGAMTGFGVMSLWKAGLDIIEGSAVGASIGVTAELQLGDIVQPAYDYVDIAWRTLFFGSVALLALEHLLDAAAWVDRWVLVSALGSSLLLHLLPSGSRSRSALLLRSVSRFLWMGAFTLILILPLSILFASKLSSVVTAPSLEEARAGFEQAGEELFPGGTTSAEGRGAQLRKIPERIEEIADFLEERGRDMMSWCVKLVAGYLFDCILFPILFFVLGFQLSKGFLFQWTQQRQMERLLELKEDDGKSTVSD